MIKRRDHSLISATALAVLFGSTSVMAADKLPLMELPDAGDRDYFSSTLGELNICDYMAERLGNDVTYAMVRGIPGITDNQRSGDFLQMHRRMRQLDTRLQVLR